MMNLEMFLVGGAVRDRLLAELHNESFTPKDEDFVVVEPKGFDFMVSELERIGFTIFETRPEFLTVRAKVPASLRDRLSTPVADFVLARKDSDTSDGRRPDFVEPGTLLDDLARRDFTINSVAMAANGELIDPHNGREDLRNGVLRFVGDPMKRIDEDGLRVMRAFRFIVTKGLMPEPHTKRALASDLAVERLHGTATERIADELNRMLKHSTVASLAVLASFFDKNSGLADAIFRGTLHLEASMKKV